jgi:hypothetical protein
VPPGVEQDVPPWVLDEVEEVWDLKLCSDAPVEHVEGGSVHVVGAAVECKQLHCLAVPALTGPSGVGRLLPIGSLHPRCRTNRP